MRRVLSESPAFRLAVLATGVLLFPACPGGGSGAMSDNTQEVVLHYDGPQDDSPNQAGNTTYEAAARFTAADTDALAGGELIEVQFYIQEAPDNCKVKVYDAGTASEPGALLYSADVTAAVAEASWNTHVLANPVTVSGGDLWISIEYTDAQTQTTIGCDALGAPVAADGRWLSEDGTWGKFGPQIDWNIRGVVEIAI
jgi:hypothetical protein